MTEQTTPISPDDVTRDGDNFFTATVDVSALGLPPAYDKPEPATVVTEVTDEISSKEKAADLMNRCLAVLPAFVPPALQAILDDMQSIRAEDWAEDVYGDTLDELLPKTDSIDVMLGLLHDPEIHCHAAPEGSSSLGVGLGFEADWDVESGTAAVVRVDAPGTSEQKLTVAEVGGGMRSYSPFD